MTAAPAEATDPAGGAPTPEPTPDPTPTPDPAPKPAEAAPAPEPKTVEDLPEWAQKQIRELRAKDGDERVAAKTLAAIQKALNPDAKGDEKPTAEALTKALSEREADARQAKTELAVYKLAAKAGADPDALLDSNSFLSAIREVDPADAKAVQAAITKAVTDNPKLRAVQAAGASGSDFSGGSGEGAVTQDKFDAMTPAEKNNLFKTNPARYRQLAGR